MPKFRRKPTVVDAVQWTGANPDEVLHFIGIESDATVFNETMRTLKGNMLVSKGDWIIRAVKGEVYSCRPDTFTETYEPVPD